MELVSIIKNFVNVDREAAINVIYNKLRGNGCRKTVEEIRQLYAMGSKDAADSLKKSLPGFTASGTFTGRRDSKSLKTYSQIIILDLDDLSPVEVHEARSRANCLPHTLLSFVSPSGLGLKIMVRVDSDHTIHKSAYTQVVQYYESELGFRFDAKTNDITRLCFMSWDPEAHFNPFAERFPVTNKSETPAIKPLQSLPHSDFTLEFEKQVKYTERFKEGFKYEEGNRNNFLFFLANNCNRKGVPLEYSLKHSLILASDLSEREVKQVVEGVYNRNVADFGKWINNKQQIQPSAIIHPPSTVITTEAHEDIDDIDTPYLPDSIFETLPDFLNRITEVFQDKRQRDIFFTGALGTLSACFSEISGYYDNKRVYPNLYSFAVAPPASGKGVLSFANDLATDYHDTLFNNSIDAQVRYEAELEEYNNKKKKEGYKCEPPEQPPFIVLLIPGNSSSASIYSLLNESKGIGLLCETEADTLSNAMKQEWGGFSDILRKATHHERLSYHRKTNKEYVEIPRPRLSVALSGTPMQVTNLIGSAEDGLFSRFLFYTFQKGGKWRSPAPTIGHAPLTQVYQEAAKEITKMALYYTAHPFQFHLTKEQWCQFDETFSNLLSKTSCFVNQEAGSNVLRLGLTTFRIAMIFTIFSAWQEDNESKDIYCNDIDFSNAMALSKVYIEHAMAVYKQLPKALAIEDSKLNTFFQSLPIEFERQTALSIGVNQLSVSERTVDNYLKKLVKNDFIEKSKHNSYSKKAA
ncbi:DUF3987 domain-containing protein [Chitinophaga sp. sic0106]|uniref:DUF3987 domain-containing protein n=1 Tax=Chitinophaga sp. sic0106 TaxID=2854785 RepID=UPI001C437550|nr:DUF3987 domain-containing protein [Chitinophaga sp. sic0106]MBV7533047.1 DUF3987 domain-containing protein [Chitinophaga sp. sic0106]